VFENERLVHNYENTLRQDCKW
ncbi:MAG: hypothetical protein QG650_569, partial [Patescibacteria group bacterium]|nr:hypothetical protein [Patescibacteria group bacterium]